MLISMIIGLPLYSQKCALYQELSYCWIPMCCYQNVWWMPKVWTVSREDWKSAWKSSHLHRKSVEITFEAAEVSKEVFNMLVLVIYTLSWYLFITAVFGAVLNGPLLTHYYFLACYWIWWNIAVFSWIKPCLYHEH